MVSIWASIVVFFSRVDTEPTVMSIVLFDIYIYIHTHIHTFIAYVKLLTLHA